MNRYDENEDSAVPSQLTIPEDFPRPCPAGSVGGAQPKLLLTTEVGRYYSRDSTPSALHERWILCEDLAMQFADVSKKTKAGKRSHMSEQDILDQYLTRLLATGWTSNEEAKWVIRRCASVLDWPKPMSAYVSEKNIQDGNGTDPRD